MTRLVALGLSCLILACPACQKGSTPAATPLQQARIEPQVDDGQGLRLLNDLRLGDSPEVVAQRIDRDPSIRPGFGPVHEIDLSMGTFQLRPVFRAGALTRIDVAAPRRTEDDAIAHLPGDLEALSTWAERRYGPPTWTKPIPEPRQVQGRRPTAVARWALEERTVLLSVSVDGYLYGAELWLAGPQEGER